MYSPQNVYTLINYGATWALIENILLAATAEGLACAIHIPGGAESSSIQKVINAPHDYVLQKI
ncbi:hypothetical protein [Priestia endophytica]|uniref:hypothetical protein n=1 Tax=Priestia endophytica TaxID=135735 RepID=UPI00115DFDC4|nr:hypothetical protein [Priestia endophytica]